ncbi:MAG: aldo/keto reductase [Planctomycetaceae bacterium]|nr:aldo/keto reductase [Planctomycetaceae bacterium]
MREEPMPSGKTAPSMLYGTAWKEEATQTLTELAIQQGFRGIDTANQRKHYYEAAVGAGIAASINQGLVIRDELFIQTKFTFRAGQDQRLPYDPRAPIEAQVMQSCASSREHLHIDHIDSYVLHGPSRNEGLGPADWSAWKAMEELHDRGIVGSLGISNVDLDQLEELCSRVRIKPRFVQNRCYAVQGWDREIREYCRGQEITYQGFSLLTANRAVMASADVARIAKRVERTPAEVIFRFALQLGMLPLTGTTNARHMQADLSVQQFSLLESEVQTIEYLAQR